MKGDDAEAVGSDLSDLLCGCSEAQTKATQPCCFIVLVTRFILLNPKSLIFRKKKFIGHLAPALKDVFVCVNPVNGSRQTSQPRPVMG